MEEEPVLVVYLDDDGKRKEVWTRIIEQNLAYVKFRDLSHNTVTIPLHRVLKIKEKPTGQPQGEEL